MWEDWRRADGTRTTWHREDDCNIDGTRWTSSQKRLRRQKASESMEMEIMTTTDIHNTATFLRSQAFDEKLKKAQREPQPNWVEETAKLMSRHQEHVHPSGPTSTQGSSSSSFSGRTSQRATTRQQTEASFSSTTVRGSSKLSGRSSVTIGAAIPAPTAPAPSPSVLTHKTITQISQKAQGKQREILPTDPTTDILQSRPSPAVLSVKAQGKQRETIPSSSTTRSLPANPSPPDPPFVLLSPQKRVKRVISESEDEVSEPPKIGPPKKEAKRLRGREEQSVPG
jgi:histone-lysine N-methyltransferase SUV39H